MKAAGEIKHSLLLTLLRMLLLVFLVGCSLSVPLSDLYGTYVADYDVAKEKVTLNKDGTFVQEVTLKATSKIDIAKGTWTYNAETGYVTFHENFMGVLDGFRKLNPNYANQKPGLAVQPVDKYFGRILLGAAEGVLYKKVE